MRSLCWCLLERSLRRPPMPQLFPAGDEQETASDWTVRREGFRTVDEMNSNKSLGPAGIQPGLPRRLNYKTAKLVTRMCNSCLPSVMCQEMEVVNRILSLKKKSFGKPQSCSLVCLPSLPRKLSGSVMKKRPDREVKLIPKNCYSPSEELVCLWVRMALWTQLIWLPQKVMTGLSPKCLLIV